MVSPSDLDRDTLRSARREFGGVGRAIVAAGLVRRRKRKPKTVSPRAKRPRKERATPRPRQPQKGALSVHHLALEPAVVRDVLDGIVRDRGLSVRESHALAAAVYGVPRSRLAEALGVTENSTKSFIRNVLRKLAVRSMDDAIWLVRTKVTRRMVERRRASSKREPRARPAKRAEKRRT